MVRSCLSRRLAVAALVACALACGLRVGSPAAAPPSVPGPHPSIQPESLAIIDRIPRLEQARYYAARAPRVFPAYVSALKRAQGDRFDLGEFHDRFLAIGRLPIPLMRTAFMDDKSYGVRSAAP